MSESRVAAVIVAAGRGRRLAGDLPKQLRDLGGRPILEWSVRSFAAHPDIADVVVVLPETLAADPPEAIVRALTARPHAGALRIIVAGGETRAASVKRGAAACPTEADVILVHDGVRPFVDAGTIERVCAAAVAGPVIPVVPVADTIKRVDADGVVVESPPRERLRHAQTPQGFPAELLRRLQADSESDAGITDEGVLCERSGIRVRTVPGSPANLKITGPEDLAHARWLVESGMIDAPTMT